MTPDSPTPAQLKRTAVRGSLERSVRMRTWLVDGIEMPDHAVIILAEDYGYGGENPFEAANVLRQWGYTTISSEAS